MDCDCHLPPICPNCKREVPKVTAMGCSECFSQWYDPDNSSFNHLDPFEIGNYVRSKHGLPPLQAIEPKS